jgi:exodeoxyribonuclease VII large subunit
MSSSPLPRVILSVSALTTVLRAQLEAGFSDVWVEGEVSNLRIPSSGHVYCTLKDASSQIKAIMFRSTARYLRFAVKDGMCLICRGRITVYEPKGEYQIIVDYAEPKGVGALQVAFEQLKERLGAEGLFEAARKRSLPRFPRRLGLITSPTGAAIRDIIQVSHKRWPGIAILVNPVTVQGTGAAADIARAIAELDDFGEIDVVIVSRGGGSLEDLWAFNDEAVARAIVACRIPVVSAVGHEVDYTIADFVADLRAPTPSAAVELILPARQEVCARVDHHRQRASQAMSGYLRHWRGRVETECRALLDPAALVQRAIQRRDELEMRLHLAETGHLRDCRRMSERLRQELLLRSPVHKIRQGLASLPHLRTRLEQRITTLVDFGRNSLHKAISGIHALNPLAILARGYSVTRRWPDMMLLRKASEIKPGDTVHIRLSAGELICDVRTAGEDAG